MFGSDVWINLTVEQKVSQIAVGRETYLSIVLGMQCMCVLCLTGRLHHRPPVVVQWLVYADSPSGLYWAMMVTTCPAPFSAAAACSCVAPRRSMPFTCFNNKENLQDYFCGISVLIQCPAPQISYTFPHTSRNAWHPEMEGHIYWYIFVSFFLNSILNLFNCWWSDKVSDKICQLQKLKCL